MFNRILPFLLILATGNLYSQSYITPSSLNVCYGDNSNTLILQNNIKPVTRWEMSVTGDDPWIQIGNQTQNMPFTNLTTTTWFRAVVHADGEPEQYSAVAEVIVWPKAETGIISGVSNVCRGSNN